MGSRSAGAAEPSGAAFALLTGREEFLVETCVEEQEAERQVWASRTLLLAGELALTVVAHNKNESTNENEAFTGCPSIRARAHRLTRSGCSIA